ncbi:MAG: hydroxyethylthiazole kinase [Chloroflexi bacterium]|nr:hydroxyethylthiazole kinase [Chloroflexota bacterium]
MRRRQWEAGLPVSAEMTPTLPDVAAVLQRVRTQRPLVHCITNVVTTGRVADALAALGALPVMASAPEEAAEMVEHAQALVLNLGTPAADRWAAARAAGVRARQRGIPIVVDPVGCGATRWRTNEARALVEAILPDVIRGNVPEVAALAGLPPPNGVALRGVTAEHIRPRDGRASSAGGTTADVPDAAARLAWEAAGVLESTVVVTGRTSIVCDGRQVAHHRATVPLLARIVGGGDVLSALIAACRAVDGGNLPASWTGLVLFSEAARVAATRAGGPGTFWCGLMDALSGLTAEALRESHGRVPPPPRTRQE